jgi:molybdopterin molybdotransferase
MPDAIAIANRTKGTRMISVEQAEKIVRENWPDFGNTEINVKLPLSMTLAQSIVGDRSYPPFHRVMMDGIALSFEAYQSGQRKFKVESICPAGSPLHTLSDQSHAIEIMTGAGLPVHADLIIPYEHVDVAGGFATVTLETERTPYQFTHSQGSDYEKGNELVPAGKKMNGPRWGIAASVGDDRLQVKRNPKIKIISTGDELVEVSAVPLDHQVRRSNAYSLMASLLSRGFSEVTLDHVQDDYESLLTHYARSAKEADVLIYSGGVSKGKFDFLPEVWRKSGVEKLFHEVSQRPGKPMWFGTDKATHTTVVGLPGNPVSSLVCLHRYLLTDRPRFARLTSNIEYAKPLTYFVPVKVEYAKDGVTLAHPLEVRNSGEYSGLAESDGFIELPKDGSEFKAGESFRLFLWGVE